MTDVDYVCIAVMRLRDRKAKEIRENKESGPTLNQLYYTLLADLAEELNWLSYERERAKFGSQT